jgi:hypothetical protein
MLTDRQVVEITLSVLGIAALGVIAGLIVYFAYLKPSLFYGDHVVLSITDVNGKSWWVKNRSKQMSFTDTQADASVLQFANGTSGQKGQLFEGNLTSFELRNPFYGAFLTAVCRAKTVDPVPGFGTNTGVQIGATSPGTSLIDVSKGSALQDGGQYHLTITGFDCEASGCIIASMTNVCNVSGCYFATELDSSATAGHLTAINCNFPNKQQQLWTMTKVDNLKMYNEYVTNTDFSFN